MNIIHMISSLGVMIKFFQTGMHVQVALVLLNQLCIIVESVLIG